MESIMGIGVYGGTWDIRGILGVHARDSIRTFFINSYRAWIEEILHHPIYLCPWDVQHFLGPEW